MSHLAALSTLSIIALLAGSSFSRYLFDMPIPITEELTALLFVALSCLSLAEGFVTGGQIRIVALWRLLPRWLQRPMSIVGHLISLIVLAVIVRETFQFAAMSYRLGSRSYISEIPLWPWMMLIPLGLGACWIFVATRLAVDIRALYRGDSRPEQVITSTETKSDRSE